MQERNATYSGETAPFWFLNDKLSTGELTRQLEEMHDRGVSQVVINPRYGLPVDLYLSDEWFGHVGHIVRSAGDMDMGVWIHDDINWPSGTVGGNLTRHNGEFAAKVLSCTNGQTESRPSSFRIAYQRAPYLDVLNPAAVDAFVQATHERYAEELGDYFGSGIKGFFCDEPGFYAGLFGAVDSGTVPFTDDLLDEFHTRRGYDPGPEIEYIWKENGADSRRIRQDYFETLTELYTERFLGRLRTWCHEHGLLFIGHLLEEEDPLNAIKSQGDPFSAGRQFDWAGYDLISKLTPDHIIAARLAKSVAQIYDKPEVVAETMGGFGWEMRPEQMQELAQWHARHGTTVLVPHALFYSTRGDRRHESPPSLREEPYWSNFGEFTREFRNAVESTQPTSSKAAIYYPVRALWAAFNPHDPSSAGRISETLKSVSRDLAREGVQFDYVNDDALTGREQSYERIILPAAETIPLESLKRFMHLAEQGVQIDFVGTPPRFASLDSDQAQVEEIISEMLEAGVANHVPYEAEYSTKGALLKGVQYKVWHELSCISPRYADWLIRVKHALNIGS